MLSFIYEYKDENAEKPTKYLLKVFVELTKVYM